MKSNLYTRTGDAGTTSLVGGRRIEKDSPRLEAYGTIDELNSHLGLLIALIPADDTAGAGADIIPFMRWLQNKMFDIGGYLATAPEDEGRWGPKAGGITTADVERIESTIDSLDTALTPLRRFLLPGGTIVAAQANVARTVCRRCERRVITLSATAPVDPTVLKFLNRLSDFLFVFARFNNINSGRDEIFWDKDC